MEVDQEHHKKRKGVPGPNRWMSTPLPPYTKRPDIISNEVQTYTSYISK